LGFEICLGFVACDFEFRPKGVWPLFEFGEVMAAVTATIQWDQDGQPHSTQFDDKYFCAEDGLAESRYVFCGGNDLKNRWSALSPDKPGTFTIAETGFGTGLNFLCAWQLWMETAPPGWRLRYLSLDRYPLSVDDLSRALLLWPALAPYARILSAQYHPAAEAQQQDFLFEDGRVGLSLFFGEAVDVLDGWRHQRAEEPLSVDAWFLDGFDPKKNSAMWSDEVFARVSDVSHTGTTLATFTVAGFVRRGLGVQGFEMVKAKGFGRKRQMLIGNYNNNQMTNDKSQTMDK